MSKQTFEITDTGEGMLMGNMKKKFDLVGEEMNTTVPTYGFQLLRHLLLPELLGEEEEMILYWAGKALARKLTDEDITDLVHFFEESSWGTLSLVKEKGTEQHYELIAPLMDKTRPLTLECGFLAQWTERKVGFITEAAYELKRKKPLTFRIIVKWDKSDPIGI
ncbi:DUF2507 domain-containing protein [Evansella tamaricis]|uniref:YslB family protein n=1 Tax=Evansella tamaricis TaxID=2069301 RepID=A0ABS6JB98_9BACI|nr:DUF2507 domain-containing protein [Evansella tamaricis]MBU9710953.1 YslB family protein [Evansella tamaricis]